MCAFLYSWIIASVVNPASTAAVSIIFGEYVSRAAFSGEDSYGYSSIWLQRCFSLLALWTAIVLNSFGTRWGLMVNNICTILKLLGVGSVFLLGVFVISIFH